LELRFLFFGLTFLKRYDLILLNMLLNDYEKGRSVIGNAAARFGYQLYVVFDAKGHQSNLGR
jgi:hypothetical protein